MMPCDLWLHEVLQTTILRKITKGIYIYIYIYIYIRKNKNRSH